MVRHHSRSGFDAAGGACVDLIEAPDWTEHTRENDAPPNGSTLVTGRAESSFSWMALDALKHRDVPKIDRMPERFVGLMAGLTFAICQPAKVNRMLHGKRGRSW